MGGLFMTPEQARAQEIQRRHALGQSQNPLAGSMFNLGYSSGNAIVRGIGGLLGSPVDTRSASEIKASDVSKAVQGLDLTNRNNVLAKVQELHSSGLNAEAAELMQLVPKLPDPMNVDRKIEEFYNPDLNMYENWVIENGQRVRNLGPSKPGAELDGLKWQNADTVRLPKPFYTEDGQEHWETAARFRTDAEGNEALQILTGEGWVDAPPGVRRVQRTITETPDKPGDPTKLTMQHALSLIDRDPHISGIWSGLKKSQRTEFAGRVISLAKKKQAEARRRKEILGAGEATDLALLELKREALKKDSLFGIPFGTQLKTSDEMVNNNSGFSIVK